MKLGFVGLGQMGSPIALNLLKSGAELVVSDRDEGRIAPLRDRGAGGTTNAAELADTDILFLCLPNTEVMRSVLTGEGGIIEHLRRAKRSWTSAPSATGPPSRSAGRWRRRGWRSWTRRSPAWRRARSRGR